jgi:type I restriction enzyme, R subunit
LKKNEWCVNMEIITWGSRDANFLTSWVLVYNLVKKMPTPEEQAREIIDQKLTAAGWVVQDYSHLNLGAGPGVAVREFQTVSGPADYALFVDRNGTGVVEAKKAGTTLSGVFDQSARYSADFPDDIPHVELPLPFSYESTGIETRFTDLRDPDYRSRRVFHFHRPETLREWLAQPNTLRGRLREMPEKHPLITEGLWDAQIEAITRLEQSFAQNKPRALIQMATGSGKTYTAVSFIYRLIKHAGAKRVLFLVDPTTWGNRPCGSSRAISRRTTGASSRSCTTSSG